MFRSQNWLICKCRLPFTHTFSPFSITVVAFAKHFHPSLDSLYLNAVPFELDEHKLLQSVFKFLVNNCFFDILLPFHVFLLFQLLSHYRTAVCYLQWFHFIDSKIQRCIQKFWNRDLFSQIIAITYILEVHITDDVILFHYHYRPRWSVLVNCLLFRCDQRLLNNHAVKNLSQKWRNLVSIIHWLG